MKARETISMVQSSLRGNPECRLGVMARTRVAFAEKGVNSYQRDKELLALISDTGWWYGHILRVDPDRLTHQGRGEWVVSLMNSRCRVDGSTPTEVLQSVTFSWYDRQSYREYFVQDPKDGFAQCHSFAEALRALCTIIARFKYKLRDYHELDPDGNYILPPGKGTLPDMAIYGGYALSDEEMYNKYELPLIEKTRKKAGLPSLAEVHS